MPVPSDRAWQLPWLRLHLLMRDVLAVPWGKDWRVCAMRGTATVHDLGGMVQQFVPHPISWTPSETR
jgi:hypothetical protein